MPSHALFSRVNYAASTAMIPIADGTKAAASEGVAIEVVSSVTPPSEAPSPTNTGFHSSRVAAAFSATNLTAQLSLACW